MSYLLIGNISALICNDCIEPLVNARIRIYLPATRYPSDNEAGVKGIFHDMKQLSAKEVLMKADRLLAETTLDENGNFSLTWDEIHLFTEALEMDLCLDQMPGKNGSHQSRNFHLSKLVPHWKRNSNGYVGAYAYVIPAEVWRTIYQNAGAWVITGLVKHQQRAAGTPRLKVEAYNALSGQLIGQAYTNETGRYMLHFSRKNLYSGFMQPIIPGRKNLGPDIYFKIYRNEQLLWSEDEQRAKDQDRQDVAPCSCLDIMYRPSVVKRASDHIGSWLNGVITLTGTRKNKRDRYRLLTHFSLL
ncbi:hypothetical protein CLV51_10818 [Chitinophaga niastensis]|uniref:Uncharacterized protein n=1 Tax=Chitinophaga niastensis TaxID=536980 RepID=A0A2P8HAW6_CHINA|nr:hypothetical protein [Chitinophaga niastensis]PSL43329.1 hypothetical protein CLV51_10818 [Chitinophaga niastensis]